MALLEILKFPDPRLRIKAKPVEQITDEINQIVVDMYETMYAQNGVGLAATQVGINHRIFVMDVSDQRNERYCVINPDILRGEGIQEEKEGCLSVGGNAFDRVKRKTHLKLRGLDLTGKPFELEAIGLMACCIQHEIDHLNGILFIDHLSRLKQSRIRKKIEKLNREK